MTTEDLIKIGFEAIPHYTVTNSHIYKLGRNRQLSIGCVGTPNEMLFISSNEGSDKREVTDLICLHNYDYDGFLSIDKILKLIDALA